MTPVMLLTDGYIANAAEPWKVPDMAGYQAFPVTFRTDPPAEGEIFLPYGRDAKGARPWVKPGTPGLLHRIGGIEKADRHRQHRLRAGQPSGDDRRAQGQGGRHRRAHPAAVRSTLGEDGGELVVVGWGSTFGPIHQAVRRMRAKGFDVSHVHLRHIWPMPQNLGESAARL